MSVEQLQHLANLLEGDAPLPPASRLWLRDSLRRWLAGLPIERALGLTAANARRERDELLRRNAQTVQARSAWHRALLLSDQVRRLHRGRRTAWPWLAQADRLTPLPETARQLYSILK